MSFPSFLPSQNVASLQAEREVVLSPAGESMGSASRPARQHKVSLTLAVKHRMVMIDLAMLNACCQVVVWGTNNACR